MFSFSVHLQLIIYNFVSAKKNNLINNVFYYIIIFFYVSMYVYLFKFNKIIGNIAF